VPAGTIVIEPVVYHVRFASAFLASISMILVSEFGDKTFFIAAILAMRNNRMEGTYAPILTCRRLSEEGHCEIAVSCVSVSLLRCVLRIVLVQSSPPQSPRWH